MSLASLNTLASQAWSLETTPYAGWTMRAAEGYTRRANSVLPVPFDMNVDIEEALAFVERWYAARSLPPTFQMFDGVEPAGLDLALRERGYIDGDIEALVLARDIRAPHLTDAETGAEDGRGVRMTIASTPSEEWANAWIESAGGEEGARDAADLACRLIESAPGEALLVSAWDGDRVIGTVYGSLQDKHVGIFCLATHRDARRRGVAAQLVQSLLAWSAQQDARVAYLQVEAENEAALALYERLGFEQVGSYHYLTRPGTADAGC